MERSSRTLRGDITFFFYLALEVALAWMIRDVLLLMYVSALFAVVLQPITLFIAGLRIGRWHPFKHIAIFVLLFVSLGGLILFGYFAIPPVMRDLNEFGREMPFRLPGLLYKLKHVPFVSQVNTDDLATKIEGFVGSGASFLLVSLKNWADGLFTIAMGLILTIYF